jgi:hypothetical protein
MRNEKKEEEREYQNEPRKRKDLELNILAR